MGSKTTTEKISNYGKEVRDSGNGYLNSLERQSVTGILGGSVYGIVWGEMNNLMETILGVKVDDKTSVLDRAYGYLFRLMTINNFEKDLTLSMLTSGAYDNGDADGFKPNVLIPLHANIASDYPDFVRNAAKNEMEGTDTTRLQYTSQENNGRLAVDNMYPDDLGLYESTTPDKTSFTSTYVWELDGGNRNSLISKTQRLFREHKINSLISRFGTSTDGVKGVLPLGASGYSDAGMSRGRNLKKVKGYSINGYNNPYCRVWTHHYQYDNYDKTIRPFSDDKGEKKRIRKWDNENFKFDAKKDSCNGWGWKNDNSEWSHSVLNGYDGVVNITPKFGSSGKSVHTKDCMFSIENLAWKDYSPIEFENTLSWEQRGPLGGRIMWFPPYGISFTENTNVTWNENTFIGRGENVYTYSNTTRTGTLSFMLLTDHPSVTDYVSWAPENGDKIDDDMWNRFFAGCDTLDGSDEDSIMHYVTPTPMDYEVATKGGGESEEEKNEEDETSGDTTDITFFVFFPNNYSGYNDSWDFAIGYLLGGVNAQKKLVENKENDIEIQYTTSESGEFINGYEMGDNPITDENSRTHGPIIGNTIEWIENPTQTEYVKDENKKYWYRVDGGYTVPSGEDIYKNNYAQTLEKPDSYKDKNSSKLNASSSSIPEFLRPTVGEVYSFAEIACAIAKKNNYNGVLNYLNPIVNNEEKISKIGEMLEMEIDSVTIEGHANNQGSNQNNETNKKRNRHLATERGKTVGEWIGEMLNCNPKYENPSIDPVETTDESESNAKAYRCAKCTIKFKNDKTINACETSNDGERINTSETIEYKLGFGYSDISKTYKNDKAISEFQKLKNEIVIPRNKIRYDSEMYFYKKFEKEHPFSWKKLNEKLQYFDPAFHSMTPEGFNMRVTFLQQCTRQGNTMSASDGGTSSTRTASNMAFGRPPFCVLRLGDFFNQMIVIKSINISYDDDGSLTWDLNDEGIGVQPMIAKVTLSFDFIGGGDLAGPVRRLQNAMSFNYYANASLYDNRADRMYYPSFENISNEMGGLKENRELDINKSVFYNPLNPDKDK